MIVLPHFLHDLFTKYGAECADLVLVDHPSVSRETEQVTVLVDGKEYHLLVNQNLVIGSIQTDPNYLELFNKCREHVGIPMGKIKGEEHGQDDQEGTAREVFVGQARLGAVP